MNAGKKRLDQNGVEVEVARLSLDSEQAGWERTEDGRRRLRVQDLRRDGAYSNASADAEVQ